MLYKGNNIYMADEGKFIYNRDDDTIIGIGICLGIKDDIDNYYEAQYTQDEYDKVFGISNEESNNEE